MNVLFVRHSMNAKTGNIPQSYQPSSTCPDACPQKGKGCYARFGNVGRIWRGLDAGGGISWEQFLDEIRALPEDQLWRCSVAGDLPGLGNRLDGKKLAQLVEANRGRRGYTYTHTPPTMATVKHIAEANRNGFTINWSCDSLKEADRKANLSAGPVVVTLPADPELWPKTTPAGRKVVVCPAVTKESVTCATCRLCARSDRTAVIGFPAHGIGRKKVEAVYFGGP